MDEREKLIEALEKEMEEIVYKEENNYNDSFVMKDIYLTIEYLRTGNYETGKMERNMRLRCAISDIKEMYRIYGVE